MARRHSSSAPFITFSQSTAARIAKKKDRDGLIEKMKRLWQVGKGNKAGMGRERIGLILAPYHAHPRRFILQLNSLCSKAKGTSRGEGK